jgi:iron-sulfur cluster assembly accessory protein|tara:strand:+ start:125 stop:430 length:306 start_codon:yes stop_codon:yes gene_type:complete
MITLTDNAKEYLTTQTANQDSKYVRLGVYGGGCSGFQYKWDFVNEVKDGTLIDNTLVLDRTSEMFVIGCTVDWVNELGGAYLKVSNPNSKASCGCGESFAV